MKLKNITNLTKKKKSKSLLEQLVSFFYYSQFFQTLCYIFFIPVPERFYGNGSIRIKGVKHVQVTNDYLRLDLQTRGCQNDNTYEGCVTNLYLDSLKERCKCLPFSLQNFSKHDEIKQVQIK